MRKRIRQLVGGAISVKPVGLRGKQEAQGSQARQASSQRRAGTNVRSVHCEFVEWSALLSSEACVRPRSEVFRNCQSAEQISDVARCVYSYRSCGATGVRGRSFCVAWQPKFKSTRRASALSVSRSALTPRRPRVGPRPLVSRLASALTPPAGGAAARPAATGESRGAEKSG